MTKKSYVVENGLTLGLISLAALVVFAIALPRWTHHQDTKAIVFPASVSGMTQVTATNTPAAATTLDSFATLDRSTTAALDAASNSVIYANQQTGQSLIVRAIRKPGGLILLPQAVGTVSKVGSDECLSTTGTDQSGQPSSSALCVRSVGTLTLQVVGGGTPDAIDANLNDIWKKIS